MSDTPPSDVDSLTSDGLDDEPLLFNFSTFTPSENDLVNLIRLGPHLHVLMPLDTVLPVDHPELRNPGLKMPGLKNPEILKEELKSIKEGWRERQGADGVCIDVWWGIVQSQDLNGYNWKPYKEFFTLCREAGLFVCPIMSFHECGGNVNDKGEIPLPKIVLDIANRNKNRPFYCDKKGNYNEEYLSLGADNEPIFEGKTPLDLYENFMNSFVAEFSEFSDIITSVEIGLGPCGELRYPSYPLRAKRWRFPGIGLFQCFDPYMSRMMGKHFKKHFGYDSYLAVQNGIFAGMKEYWDKPLDTSLFHPESKLYLQEPMMNFFKWYSDCLVEHGRQVLTRAIKAFSSMKDVKIVAKIAGIHWQYDQAHAAEMTAGYFNSMTHEDLRNPSTESKSFMSAMNSSFYYKFALVCSELGVEYNYTCFELDRNNESNAFSNPEQLFKQIFHSVRLANVRLRGENALLMERREELERIIDKCKVAAKHMTCFSYLRYGEKFNPDFFEEFATKYREIANLPEFQGGPNVDKDPKNIY